MTSTSGHRVVFDSSVNGAKLHLWMSPGGRARYFYSVPVPAHGEYIAPPENVRSWFLLDSEQGADNLSIRGDAAIILAWMLSITEPTKHGNARPAQGVKPLPKLCATSQRAVCARWHLAH